MGVLGDADKKQQANSSGTRDTSTDGLRRGVIAALTVGTSEIKTGGGEYGDETLADSIFPKTINDMNNQERQQSRMNTDMAKAKALDTQKRALVEPDPTDVYTRRAAAGRLMSGNGRKSSFLTGGGTY